MQYNKSILQKNKQKHAVHARNSRTYMYNIHVLFLCYVLLCQCDSINFSNSFRLDGKHKHRHSVPPVLKAAPLRANPTHLFPWCVCRTENILFLSTNRHLYGASASLCQTHLSADLCFSVSFVQVVAALFLSLSLPPQPHYLASFLLLSFRRLVWTRCIQRSLGPADHSS